eukprot:1161671-Pelagomonas_calceolata.AAC.27
MSSYVQMSSSSPATCIHQLSQGHPKGRLKSLTSHGISWQKGLTKEAWTLEGSEGTCEGRMLKACMGFGGKDTARVRRGSRLWKWRLERARLAGVLLPVRGDNRCSGGLQGKEKVT